MQSMVCDVTRVTVAGEVAIRLHYSITIWIQVIKQWLMTTTVARWHAINQFVSRFSTLVSCVARQRNCTCTKQL